MTRHPEAAIRAFAKALALSWSNKFGGSSGAAELYALTDAFEPEARRNLQILMMLPASERRLIIEQLR